jgi:exosortase/archaeosortase family protein
MIFGDEFLKTFTTPVFSVVFIMIVFFSMSYMLTTAWRFFSGTVAQFVSQLLHLTFENISYEIASVPSLELYSFKVLIGNACSGIDSLSLFFSIYLLIMMYDFSRIRLKRALALLPVGLLGMFVMTVFRIYILMVVGKFNAELSIGLFHDNLGWIFFVVYIILFWYFAYGFILEKKHLPSKKA